MDVTNLWQEDELALIDSGGYIRSYPNLDAWANFTHKSGLALRSPVFWNGSAIWRPLFIAPLIGNLPASTAAGIRTTTALTRMLFDTIFGSIRQVTTANSCLSRSWIHSTTYPLKALPTVNRRMNTSWHIVWGQADSRAMKPSQIRLLKAQRAWFTAQEVYSNGNCGRMKRGIGASALRRVQLSMRRLLLRPKVRRFDHRNFRGPTLYRYQSQTGAYCE